jgi:hypothetical protein
MRQRPTLTDKLRLLGAGDDAVKWAADKTFEQAYIECKRGDRMLWLAAKLFPRARVVLAACDCAEQGLRYAPGEDRLRVALDDGRRWARGELTMEQMRAAYQAAFEVACGPSAADTRAARIAASYCAAACAAACEDDATDAAYAVVLAAPADSFAASADIVRRHFSFDEFLNAMEAV